MAKRYLTDQQKRRIASRQDHFVMPKSGDEQAGLVVSYLGKQLEVETNSGENIICHPRQNLGTIVVGDQVIWARQNEQSGVIIAKKERRSVLTRPDPYKQEKIIAANVDQMVIVIAACPEPIWHFLDKYLVAAKLQGLNALIVINKIDLLSESEKIQLDDRLRIYRKLDYPCLEVSCESHLGLTELIHALQSKISIFVGQSGVGKSSLINALFQQDMAKIGEISVANKKGQHTTTSAQLYHFPGGGDLIDSPGIREFGLWHISRDEVVMGFKEIYHYAGLCKFRDCQHQNTKGCAVTEAVNKKEIDAERLQSYFRVLDEIRE